jgi:DNA-binding NtrC family response regulator
MIEKTGEITIFILEDDPDYQSLLKKYLGGHFSLVFAENLPNAIELFSEDASLAIVDICLDRNNLQNKDGLEFISYMAKTGFRMPIIVLSGYTQEDLPEVVASSFKSGVIDYLLKSKITPTFLVKLVNDTLDRYALRKQVDYLKKRVNRLETWEMIGECKEIKLIKEEVLQVADDGYASVLITGETGTGKELVANAIHQKGWRKEAPFTSFSVADLPRELIQKELFGHEKGSYTGADRSKPGYIETTQGGVLFLDEVTDIPVDIQGMLLRILEERKLRRIGSTRPVKVDFQLACATNKDVRQLMGNGEFRKDLYYRLNTFQIHLPPLRERGEDVLLIAGHFLKHFRETGRSRCRDFSAEVFEAFMRYPWPGNIRELKNIIEGAVIKSKIANIPIIDIGYLPAGFQDIDAQPDRCRSRIAVKKMADPNFTPFPIDLKLEQARNELRYIEMALKSVKGKKTEAWKIIGLPNRFKLKILIEKDLHKYPELIEEFPYINDCYKVSSHSSGMGLKSSRKHHDSEN